MPAEHADPLRVDRAVRADGLTVARQAPPPGSAGFAATFVSPSGWAFDPSGREGLAVVTSLTAPVAAGRRDRVALARELDRLGGSLHRHCAPESSEVGVSGPATEAERLLSLLADVVLRPRFASDDVEKVRREIAERQLRDRTQPGFRAEREMLRTVFPAGHPYRESGIGTPTSLRRLRRADLGTFHRARTIADGSFLVLTTPWSLENVVRRARREFPELPQEHGPGRTTAGAAPRARRQYRRIAMPGRTQTEVRLGGLAPPRADPAFPALFLANEVLGGRQLLNRLFQNVREARGLAYHASSELEAMRWGGYWSAQAGTGPERAQEVVRLVTREVRRVGERPVPLAELETIRESTIGEIPLALETAADAHELAVDVAYHGLADDHWKTWPAVLRSVTPAKLLDAASAVFDPDLAVTVVAGTDPP